MEGVIGWENTPPISAGGSVAVGLLHPQRIKTMGTIDLFISIPLTLGLRFRTSGKI